jgi:hypothetical protein
MEFPLERVARHRIRKLNAGVIFEIGGTLEGLVFKWNPLK